MTSPVPPRSGKTTTRDTPEDGGNIDGLDVELDSPREGDERDPAAAASSAVSAVIDEEDCAIC